MINLLLASSNKHKACELSTLLGSELFSINTAPAKLEVEENGKTFAENALIKAKAYWAKYKKPVVADDSGINVSALPDELGIYSARFGGEDLDHNEKCKLLIKKLENTPKEGRSAHFICVLCIYLNPDEIFFFEGKLEGVIGYEIKGEHGFGYDPIFQPNEVEGDTTVAQIPEWKEENSHRAKACLAASIFFKEKNCQI